MTTLLCVPAHSNVFVNQAGYLQHQSKAFVTDRADSTFEVVRVETGRAVVSGTAMKRELQDPATGMDLYWGDFSEISEPGTYRIRLSDGRVSYPFRIAADVYDEVALSSLRSYYLQRCGVALDTHHGGIFARGSCHQDDAAYHPELGSEGKATVTGGWHDAGDFGKYTHSAAVSLGHMLMMYEQFPDRFEGDDNNIPESGNGIPDFLDEMAHELDWMLTMQVVDQSDKRRGGVHYMVNTRDYGWTTAEKDKDARFLHAVTSVSTADFAAAMALAGRIFDQVPGLESKGASYRQAAELAWEFLTTRPNLYPDGGFIRPADTKTGGYADSPDMNDRDDRLWAAVELAITTGNPDYIRQLADRNDPYLMDAFFESTSFDEDLRWQDTSAFGFVQAVLNKVPGLSPQRHAAIRKQFLEHCERLLGRVEDDGFGVALDRYYWGSTGGALALGQLLIFGTVLEPQRQAFVEGALHQLHFVLGRNALDTSFVSGIGSRFPQAIHHATFENDDIDPIFPGLIAGGPNPGLNGDYTLPKYFTTDSPPALCYIDHIDSWASNENCILYNAPLVALAYYFSSAPDVRND